MIPTSASPSPFITLSLYHFSHPLRESFVSSPRTPAVVPQARESMRDRGVPVDAGRLGGKDPARSRARLREKTDIPSGTQ